MAKRRKPITAAKLLERLAQDENYQRMKREQDAHFTRMEEEFRVAEEPLVRELRAAGADVESVWDLIKVSTPYPALVPILIQHLHLPYPLRIREGIARALATPEANPVFDQLLAAFFAQQDGDMLNREMKFALHLAVAYSASPAQHDVLMRLLRDQTLQINRTEFAAVLWRSRDREARALVKSLRSDPFIGDEIGRIVSGKRLK